jgi:hypothetical protein
MAQDESRVWAAAVPEGLTSGPRKPITAPCGPLTQLAPAEATLGHSLGSHKPALPDGPVSAANVPTGRPPSAGAARGGFTRLF